MAVPGNRLGTQSLQQVPSGPLQPIHGQQRHQCQTNERDAVEC